MDYKKFFMFFFVFLITLNLDTVFACNIGNPKTIEKIFPDPTVAKQIEKILCKSSTSDEVNQVELNSIKEFSCEGVSNIAGFQYLNNLDNFSATYGKISDLSPLSELVNLKRIILRSNKITNISPLSNLTKLETLDLTCNLVTDLKPLSNLTNLFFLSIQCNKVEDVSVLSFLKELRILNVSQNPVRNILPLRDLRKLIELQTLSTFIPKDDYTQLYIYRNHNFIERWLNWIVG